MNIRIIKSSEMRRVTEFMKQFEQASRYVTVDVDHATETYVRMIDDGTAVVMVIEDNGELAGSLGFIIAPDLHNGEITAIETFWFTSPEKRGCGLRLFNAFEKYSKDHGTDKIAMVHMMDSYPDSLEKLYTRRGYRLVEKHYVKMLNERTEK